MIRQLIRHRQVEPRLQFTGQKYLDIPDIQLFRYSTDHLNETAVRNDMPAIIENIREEKEDEITWVNIHGLHDTETVHQLANYFNIDKLVVQDIVDTNQRPKVEVHADYIFFSVKSVLPVNHQNIESEQISFIRIKFI